MRLSLGARGSVSFAELLNSHWGLIDVGSPPLGCEDLARFISSLYMLKLTRAIFSRSGSETRRVIVLVDEWQEGLMSNPEAAENYERVLSMARSKKVLFVLVSQSLAGAAKASATLPKIVSTNTQTQIWFRASPDDAQSAAARLMLPVTGRKSRARAAPWESAAKSPFLSDAEELSERIAELASLPGRTFYFWNRTKPYPAELVRAVDIQVAPMNERDPRTARLRDGCVAVPIAELRRTMDPTPGFRAVTRSATPTSTLPRPRRRSER
jgi:hypothetical protein